ncbi:hypothetical protein HPB48_007011 [Haemaphysalis longicornis]|uniref:Uncharacterized protein n=1 Tax=Haemaphysalis longicornis TaxID=44386 RepID=A0A9J6FDA0_HAELO|nr:hypothetical protein HPB48_007011 [Haemaphysalis longicornis]
MTPCPTTACATRPGLRCRQNAAKAKGEPAPKHRYNLPPHVCKALLPVYERLSDEKLLQRCLQGKTQNSNESLHSMIWALAPKQKHASLFTVQAAVAEAVLKFNTGNERASAAILKELDLNPGLPSTKRLEEPYYNLYGSNDLTLKTRSLPSWGRAKQRPLSTEDDLSELYAKVNFSKRRKNRMRNDSAAAIAATRSYQHQQCYLSPFHTLPSAHTDTDSLVDNEAVVVYDERTAV